MCGGDEGSSGALASPLVLQGCTAWRGPSMGKHGAGRGGREDGKRIKVAFSPCSSLPPRKATRLAGSGVRGGCNRGIDGSGPLQELCFSPSCNIREMGLAWELEVVRSSQPFSSHDQAAQKLLLGHTKKLPTVQFSLLADLCGGNNNTRNSIDQKTSEAMFNIVCQLSCQYLCLTNGGFQHRAQMSAHLLSKRFLCLLTPLVLVTVPGVGAGQDAPPGSPSLTSLMLPLSIGNKECCWQCMRTTGETNWKQKENLSISLLFLCLLKETQKITASKYS